jgi:autotransporter-associated beta strand protein
MDNYYGMMKFDCVDTGHIYATDAFSSYSGTVRNVNGVLLGYNGLHASLIIDDSDGKVGFVTQNASYEFERFTNTLDLTAGNATAADHVSLASDLTRTADLNFSTLDIDASANAVNLDLGGKSFQNDGAAKGRGVVVNGTYPVTVSGGAHGAVSYAYIYNYGTEKLSWELTNNICIFTTAGPGLIEFTKSLPGDLIIAGGTTRISAEGAYTGGLMRMFGDGVLEIGADLNGGSAGDFSRWIGYEGNNIQFYAGGGFSAYGADRTVNLAGQSPSRSYPWITPTGFPLIFSSPYADSTLVFENPLDMYNFLREVRVHDGSAAIDARMTGNISGYGTAGLVKSGDGTLELTGQQEYRGDVSVISGGLRLGADDVFAGGTNRLVLSEATLDAATFSNSFNTFELLTDSTFELNDGSAALSFDDSSDTTWTGILTINGDLNATTLRFGTDNNGLTSEQLESIAINGAWTMIDKNGYLYSVLKGTLIILR